MRHWWHSDNSGSARRELILVLDLVAACIMIDLLADRWVAEMLVQFQHASVIDVLSRLPDRLQLSFLFIGLMAVLTAYRFITANHFPADRGMYVLGSGAVAGFFADRLKIVFGRPHPDAWLGDGLYGFHLFGGTDGLDSFPSAHAAIAAGLAAAALIIWPAHRRALLLLEGTVAATRFITGAHRLRFAKTADPTVPCCLDQRCQGDLPDARSQ